MFEWYKDKHRGSYVGVYTSQGAMQREVKAAAKHGWIVQGSGGMGGHLNMGRTLVGAGMTGGLSLFFGGSRSKDKLTVSFIRLPVPAAPIVNVSAAALVQQAPAPRQYAKREPEQRSAPPPVTRIDVADQLLKLADLRDREVLTAEQFEDMKADLLDRAFPPEPGPPPGITLADAAQRLHTFESSLLRWIEHAGCQQGGTFTPPGKGFRAITVEEWQGELRVTAL